MKYFFLAEVDEKYAIGAVVRTLPNAKEYPLRGLSYPLEFGMNNKLDLENYFEGRIFLRSWEKLILSKYHPDFYRKLMKRLESSKKNFLERIFNL